MLVSGSETQLSGIHQIFSNDGIEEALQAGKQIHTIRLDNSMYL